MLLLVESWCYIPRIFSVIVTGRLIQQLYILAAPVARSINSNGLPAPDTQVPLPPVSLCIHTNLVAVHIGCHCCQGGQSQSWTGMEWTGSTRDVAATDISFVLCLKMTATFSSRYPSCHRCRVNAEKGWSLVGLEMLSPLLPVSFCV